MSKRVHLLLIEPNATHVKLIRDSLSHGSVRFNVTMTSTPLEAERLLLGKHHFDLVVTEGEWPNESRDWLSSLKLHTGALPIIMLSSSSDEVKAVAYMKMGVDDYLVKRRDTLKKLPQLFLKPLQRKRKKESSHTLGQRIGKGMNTLTQNLKLLAEMINQPAASLKKGERYLKQKHGLEKEIETLKRMLKNWIK